MSTGMESGAECSGSLPILNQTLNYMCLESTKPDFLMNDQATFVTKNQRLCEAGEVARLRLSSVPRCHHMTKPGVSFGPPSGAGVQRRDFDVVLLCNGYRTEFPVAKD